MFSVAEDDHELLIHLPLPPKRVMTPSFQPSYLKEKKSGRLQPFIFQEVNSTLAVVRAVAFHCMLPTACFPLHASSNMFPTACFPQHAFYSMIPTACFWEQQLRKQMGRNFPLMTTKQYHFSTTQCIFVYLECV